MRGAARDQQAVGRGKPEPPDLAAAPAQVRHGRHGDASQGKLGSFAVGDVRQWTARRLIAMQAARRRANPFATARAKQPGVPGGAARALQVVDPFEPRRAQPLDQSQAGAKAQRVRTAVDPDVVEPMRQPRELDEGLLRVRIDTIPPNTDPD